MFWKFPHRILYYSFVKGMHVYVRVVHLRVYLCPSIVFLASYVMISLQCNWRIMISYLHNPGSRICLALRWILFSCISTLPWGQMWVTAIQAELLTPFPKNETPYCVASDRWHNKSKPRPCFCMTPCFFSLFCFLLWWQLYLETLFHGCWVTSLSPRGFHPYRIFVQVSYQCKWGLRRIHLRDNWEKQSNSGSAECITIM